MVIETVSQFVVQLQSPTLAFLLGGVLLAALGSKLAIPSAVYQFVVFILLMKIGLKAGIEIRNAHLLEMLFPAALSVVIGAIVLAGQFVFSNLSRISRADGLATAGLFGAVSASTLAAAIVVLEEQQIEYEAWVPALYPFMDIPALILAVVLANMHHQKSTGGRAKKVDKWAIVKDSLRGSALSAMLLGLLLGLLARPEPVLESFFEPVFRGMLAILMLVIGMEAWARLKELREVAHWFALYALVGPIVHGLVAFGLGYVAHVLVGFSPGGVILLATIAASNSDISGPPTIRAGIPWANPSAYIGASTSVGTPVALVVCVPMFAALGRVVFHL